VYCLNCMYVGMSEARDCAIVISMKSTFICHKLAFNVGHIFAKICTQSNCEFGSKFNLQHN